MSVGIHPRDRALFGLTVVLFAASLIFGGGAAAGVYLSDTLLQLLSIPCLLLALWRLAGNAPGNVGRNELLICAALVAIPLVQLVPLPPAVWNALPARDFEASALQLAADAASWMPLSMAPKATWVSAMTLLPPVAVFLAAAQLTNHDRRNLSLVFLAAAVFSAFAGLLQTAHLWLAESEGSPEAVGLFANRNHFAALIYCATVFAAVWAINGVFWRKNEAARTAGPRYAIVLIGGFALLTLLLGAQMMARSRAGLGLTILTLVGMLALTYADNRRSRATSASGMIIAAVVTAVVFSLQFALVRMLNRFDADPLADARLAIAKNTFSAIKAAFPVGTGLGSFVPVYGAFEMPQDALIDRFINHAHNDVLELLLETGLPGAIVMAAGTLWFLSRTRAAWWSPTEHGLEVDHGLTRAAALIIALLVLHSLVDYHLRTAALMVTVAFCAALLVEAPPDPAHRRVPEDMAHAVRQPAKDAPPTQSKTMAAARAASTKQFAWPETTQADAPRAPGGGTNKQDPQSTTQPGSNWSDAIEWPEAWRTRDSTAPGPKDEPDERDKG